MDVTQSFPNLFWQFFALLCITYIVNKFIIVGEKRFIHNNILSLPGLNL